MSVSTEQLFSDALGMAFGAPQSSHACTDWKETSEAHIFKLDLPGLTKDEVKLQLIHGDLLEVSAERKDADHGGESAGWHCKERPTGVLGRRFRLPENALADQIRASMHDGVLVVTVPKDTLKKKRPGHRAVEISGDEKRRVSSAKGLGRFVCCKA